ncbi:MAG: RNA repair domain-containing protein [Blastocatellia bacterium]|nr:RNA repair domain-containing protein [Blastocatellia bacterium]
MNPPKSKLATSQEIYNRIVWDSRLDRTAFVMGYADRMTTSGLREKMLSDWDPTGDIPWHRVRYIRCGQTTVWDRDERLDLFATDALPPEAWASASHNTVSETPKPKPPETDWPVQVVSSPAFHCQEPVGWNANPEGSFRVVAGRLRVVTWNLLADRFKQDWLRTSDRIPALLRHLQEQQADILALQEVTPALWQALLAQDWLKSWYVSEPENGDTVDPYGVCLLSRFPFAYFEKRFSAHKRLLIGSWQLNGRILNVAVVHPPSGDKKENQEARSQHLQSLTKLANQFGGNWVLAGDFNIRAEVEFAPLRQNGFLDLWPQHQPDDPGFTFDPQVNELAAKLSLTGKPARFDRIWLRSEALDWKPESVCLFGNQPFATDSPNFFPSDHFGVAADFTAPLQVSPAWNQTKPVPTSALVIEIPAELAGEIQVLRQRHDARFERWMPHLTLLYPFLPEAELDEAEPALEYLLAGMPPFTLRLEGIGCFSQAKSNTVWLRPIATPVSALQELHEWLKTLFSNCGDKHRAGAFTPHVTVGQTTDLNTIPVNFPTPQPIEFQVTSISLITREGNTPFRTRKRFPLRSVANHPTSLEQLAFQFRPPVTETTSQLRQTISELIQQACSEVLGFEAQLLPTGSELLGTLGETSDLDRICVLPVGTHPKEFLMQVEARLAPLATWTRLVWETTVPVLRLEISEIQVDVLAARSHSVPLGSEVSVISQSIAFEQSDWLVLCGWLEGNAIREFVSARLSFELFQRFLLIIRGWAACRQLTGNAWGWWGGVSWALAAAWTLSDFRFQPDKPVLEALAAHFFTVLASHDWNQPVCLKPVQSEFEPGGGPSLLPVLTSVSPLRNSTRNVTETTAYFLKKEFSRAARLCAPTTGKPIDWQQIFQPFSLKELPVPILEFRFSEVEPVAALGWGANWLEGHIGGTLLTLEKRGLGVRPWPKLRFRNHQVSALIGIGLSLKLNGTEVEGMLNNIGHTLRTQLEYERPAGYRLQLTWHLHEALPEDLHVFPESSPA